jgi:hypothetical protein
MGASWERQSASRRTAAQPVRGRTGSVAAKAGISATMLPGLVQLSALTPDRSRVVEAMIANQVVNFAAALRL